MRVKKKNVYYCDFCKKKSLRSLKIHEEHCTGNPDRICRLCETSTVRHIIDKYRNYVEIITEPDGIFEDSVTVTVKYTKEFTLQDIKNELDYNCPNCILTIIRCVGLNRFYFSKSYEFDYKKALSEWWGEVDREARMQDERDTYG